MNLERMVDLEPLPGPLRFYVVTQSGGYYQFRHRVEGFVLRIKAIEVHSAYAASLNRNHVVDVFEDLLPALCFGCGLLLEGNEIRVCRRCETQRVNALREIARQGHELL